MERNAVDGTEKEGDMLETGHGWGGGMGFGGGGLDTDEIDGDATGCGDRMEEFGLDEGGDGSGCGDENGGGYGGVMDEVEYNMYTPDYVMLELWRKDV